MKRNIIVAAAIVSLAFEFWGLQQALKWRKGRKRK